jgi:hypothetical protein
VGRSVIIKVKVTRKTKGGPGSGNWNHKGRPGLIGGSSPQGKGSTEGSDNIDILTKKDFTAGVPQDILTTAFWIGGIPEYSSGKVAANWNIAREDLVELMREDGWGKRPELMEEVAKRSTARNKKEFLYEKIRSWGGSSGGTAVNVMVNHLNSKLKTGSKPIDLGEGTTKYFQEHATVKKSIESAADAMYKTTQDWFAKRGITHVKVYRGGYADDAQKPYTSWSAIQTEIRRGSNRIYKEAVIPVRQILSIPPTGFGTLVELEVVVLGPVENWNIMKW